MADLSDLVNETIERSIMAQMEQVPAGYDCGDAILALPQIASGQAALALLKGDRRAEAIEVLHGTMGNYYTGDDEPGNALDALAALTEQP